MAEEQTSNKDHNVEVPTLDDLSNDDVTVIHNIFLSGITVPVRLAKNVAHIQEWTKKIIAQRNIKTEK